MFDIKDYIGQTVKIKPGQSRKAFTVAKLVRVSESGRHAVIIPKNHRHEEIVPVEEIKIWKKGLALNQHPQDLSMPSSLIIWIPELKLFWTSNRAPHLRWSSAIKQAFIFPSERGANTALGLMKGTRSKKIQKPFIGNHTPIVDNIDNILKQLEPTTPTPVLTTPMVSSEVGPVEFVSSRQELEVLNEDANKVYPDRETPSENPPQIEIPTVIDLGNPQVTSEVTAQSLYEKYEKARIQVVVAKTMVLDAEKEMVSIEAEIDCFLKKQALKL